MLDRSNLPPTLTVRANMLKACEPSEAEQSREAWQVEDGKEAMYSELEAWAFDAARMALWLVQ